MRLGTVLYILIPLGANGVLAFGAFLLPHVFTENSTVCYWVAGIATATSLVSIGGFFLHDIGPLRAVASLISQAMALIFVFAGIYRGFGLDGAKPLVAHDIALYFSIVTWTTLGYGDLAPARGIELLAALQAGLGYVFLGLIVGLVANLLSGRAN